MAKVIALHDCVEIKAPGTPITETIEELEKLLEMARAGEISGFVAFAVHADELVSEHRNTRITYRMLGALQTALVEYATFMRA